MTFYNKNMCFAMFPVIVLQVTWEVNLLIIWVTINHSSIRQMQNLMFWAVTGFGSGYTWPSPIRRRSKPSNLMRSSYEFLMRYLMSYSWTPNVVAQQSIESHEKLMRIAHELSHETFEGLLRRLVKLRENCTLGCQKLSSANVNKI